VGDPELGYAVGLAHRGRGLAARAVRVMSEYGLARPGVTRLVLRIPPGNVASGRVATTAGYSLTDEPLVTREAKGRSVALATWELLSAPPR
jgi:RimJ/RimL family protein N-acetyltransferase